MSDDHLFVCPETAAPLKKASKQRLTAVNKKIAAGTQLGHDGKRIVTPIDGGYETEDKTVLYPERNGILCFLISDRIVLKS